MFPTYPSSTWLRRCHSGFVLSRAFVIFLLRSPHALSFDFCPFLSPPIFIFQVSKLSSTLCFIHCRQTPLEHLKSNVSPQEPLPDIYCGDCSFILITLVNVGSHSSVKDVRCKEVHSFLGERLGGSAEMGKLWGIHSRQSDMNLCRQSISSRYRYIYNLIPSSGATHGFVS